MKKINHVLSLFLLLSAGISYTANSQNVGINTTGASPSSNAILDLNTGNVNNVGLIIPNVTLGATLAGFKTPAGPMANNANATDKGMMVYNSSASNQPIGYYYWNGATWVSVSGGAATVTGAANGLTMNGTNVQLGGANALTGNTNIASGGFDLAFTGNGAFQLGASFGSTGTLQFFNNFSNKVIGISAGVTTASYNLTLPLTQGAPNTVLTNNGFGTLSWGAPAVGGANNGLTMNGTNVQLGGANALLANTNIVSGGFNLAFTGTGNFQLGSAFNSTGELDFLNSGSGNLVGISAGATTTTYSLTLPLTQGAPNTVLTNNGTGVLSWSAPAGSATANNGLTVSGGNVQLGGANALLANTTINSGGFNLSFTGTGNFQLGAPSSSTGELDLFNSGSALGVGITTGATTSTYTLTLPTTPPASAGQVLASTTGGTMSWSTLPSGGPGVLLGIIYVTSTTGTVNFVAGTTAVLIRAIGGGGAGGGVKYGGGCSSNPDLVGGGGGAGGYCEGFVSGLSGANYQITIGAGGIGSASCAPPVSATGGNTIVKINGATTFTANGGAVGPTYESGVAGAFTGGAGGTAVGGNLNISGSAGGWCSTSTTGTDGDFAGCGGNSSFGSGGSSVYTRDHIRIAGVAASAPGAGGGGAVIAQASSTADIAAGGNGASGVVIIYEYQ